MEDRPPYDTGHAATPEPAPTTEDLIALAHAHHQGIPYETGEPLLDRLPPQMRTLADVILGGKMTASDMAYAVVALINRIENALAAMDQNSHGFTPPPAALPHGPPETARPQTPGLGKP